MSSRHSGFSNLFELPLHSLKCDCLTEQGCFQQIVFFLESNQFYRDSFIANQCTYHPLEPNMLGKTD